MLRVFSGYIFSSVLFVCVQLQEDDGRVIFVDVPLYSNSQPKEIYVTRERTEGSPHYQKPNKAEILQVPYDDYIYRSSQDAYLFQNSQQNYQQQQYQQQIQQQQQQQYQQNQQQQYQQQPQKAYSQLQSNKGAQQGSVFRPEHSNERYTQVPTQSQSYTKIPQEVTKVYTYQSQVFTTRPPKTNVYQAQGGYTTRTPYTTTKVNSYRPQNTYTTTVTPQHLPQSFSYQSQNVPTQHRTSSYTLKPYTTRVPVAITKGNKYISQDAYTTKPPKVPAKPITLPKPSSPRSTTKPWVPSKTIIITQPPSVRLEFQDTKTPPISRTPVRPFQSTPSRSNQPPGNTRNRGVSLTTDRNSVIPESQFTTSRPGKIPPYSKEVSDKGSSPTFDHLDCPCPRNLNPVCASNGLTYPNDCVFKCALKKDNPDLILRHKGSCLSSTTTSLESVLTLVD